MRKRLVLVAGAVVFGGLVLAAPASACDDGVVVISPTPVPIDLPFPGTPVRVEPSEGLFGDFADLASPGSTGAPM